MTAGADVVRGAGGAGGAGGVDDTAELTRAEVEEFLFLEARLADESDYDGWESLWTEDAIYWVPAGQADADPRERVSVIFDNRSRIATRLNQLRTGRRYAQSPPSGLRRVVSTSRCSTMTAAS